MDRTDKEHREEALNLRCFYLRLLKRIWIVPLAAVIGAMLFAGVYTAVTVMMHPYKTYRSESRLYISFAYDEKTGTKVDWYNAFTWNGFMTTDDIFNPILTNLERADIKVLSDEEFTRDKELSGAISRQEILDSITVDIPSDVRVMLLTVENADKQLADAITKAAIGALVNYGNTNDAFDSIKLLGTEDAKLVVYSDRTLVAAIFGAVVCVIFTILFMMLFEATNDAVYVPEDAEARYGLPVLGVLFRQSGKDVFFRNELLAAIKETFAGKTEVAFISVDSINDAKNSVSDLENLKSVLGDTLSDMQIKADALAVPGTVLDNYRKISTSDGVVLMVPEGKRCGTMTEHVIAQLKKHECPILGLVMVRADRRFMEKYYRIKE